MFQRLLAAAHRAVPSQCAVCRAWPAQPLCGACSVEFGHARARCLRCALPIPAGVDVDECGKCLAEPPVLDECHAAVSYGYPWSYLVAQYKFKGEPGWARVFANLMRCSNALMASIDRADCVLPMPLARERLAERGFNQALALARLLAPARTDAGLLLRIRNTPAQSALERRARIGNVQGAFALDPMRAGDVRGKRVVLVDDVMTSGASLHASARVVREGGASHVAAVVFARTDDSGG